jgi:hypothetical protein
MTTYARHRDLHVEKLTIGREAAPLLVVDHLMQDAEGLLELAASKMYSTVPTFYPGVRAKVPLAYQQFVIDTLQDVIAGHFGRDGRALRFTACHFSLVTTPRGQLSYLQRIPHVDSLSSVELAFVHYLFRADLGGTAFYRHRATGFEFVDKGRYPEYQRHLQAEQAGPDAPPPDYIHGDTPLYERIGHQEGVFNRLILYRRTTLHSGAIGPGFVPDPNPRTGRLSVNGFLV